jgi:hypothetical protein
MFISCASPVTSSLNSFIASTPRLFAESEKRRQGAKLELKADSLTCRRFPARQVRMLHGNTVAYLPFLLPRRPLTGTLPEAAQANTLKLSPPEGAHLREAHPPYLGPYLRPVKSQTRIKFTALSTANLSGSLGIAIN